MNDCKGLWLEVNDVEFVADQPAGAENPEQRTKLHFKAQSLYEGGRDPCPLKLGVLSDDARAQYEALLRALREERAIFGLVTCKDAGALHCSGIRLVGRDRAGRRE